MKYTGWIIVLLLAIWGCDDDTAASQPMPDMGPRALGMVTPMPPTAAQRDMSVAPGTSMTPTIGQPTGAGASASMGGGMAANMGGAAMMPPSGGAASLECSPELACNSEGAVECFGQTTIRTCARDPNSGCLEWGSQRLCAVGQQCLEGTCREPGEDMSGCANECAPGQSQCAGANVQLCARDLDGCNVWGEARPCGDGSACMAGQCSGGGNPCENAGEPCAQLNGLQCLDQSLYRICQRDQNGCLVWGSAGRCNAGTTCMNGQCVGNPNMQPGGGGNPPGGGNGNQPPGRNCLFGDQCQPGDQRCLGAFGISNCQLSQASQCYEFIAFEACPNGGRCVNDVCQDPGMGNQCVGMSDCDIGEIRCNGDLIQTCQDFGGCGRWTLGQCANPAEVCRDGECVNPAGANCANQECIPGQRRCVPGDNFGRFNECLADFSGCGFWDNTPFLCPGNESCNDGRCTPDGGGNMNPGGGNNNPGGGNNNPGGGNNQCAEECDLGDQRCMGNRSYEVCEADPFNAECTRWSAANVCAFGLECDANSGECVCEPDPNACQQLDASRCDNNNAQVCQAVAGTNGQCLRWSNRQLCGVGFTCQVNAGRAECVIDNGGGNGPGNNNCPNQECVPGEKECVGNDGFGQYYPCIEGFSGCGMWDRLQALVCPGAQVCRNNQCVNP